MNTYLSEEEQVEALKKWWKENGKSVIGGVVLGLLIVGGWRGWQYYDRGQGEAAAARFEQVLVAAEAGQADSAFSLAARLDAEFPGSPYTFLAALHVAKLKLAGGDKAGARGRLEWVRLNAQDPAIRQVATLRLARVLVDTGELDDAQRILDGAAKDAFAPELAELRGDLARARGQVPAARAAYEEALLGNPGSPLIRMKLDDLPAAGGNS
jgi:predicted negative regulator of RcsB-dependent stress response